LNFEEKGNLDFSTVVSNFLYLTWDEDKFRMLHDFQIGLLAITPW
jgi:hypothetical protein